MYDISIIDKLFNKSYLFMTDLFDKKRTDIDLNRIHLNPGILNLETTISNEYEKNNISRC